MPSICHVSGAALCSRSSGGTEKPAYVSDRFTAFLRIHADASRKNSAPGGDDNDWDGPGGSTRAVREYLGGLDATAPPPKEISLSDPASRLSSAVGRSAFFGWSTNYLIDVKHAVIMDMAATPAHLTTETEATQ